MLRKSRDLPARRGFPDRRREIILRATIVSGSLLLAAGVAEFATRLYVFGPAALSYTAMRSIHRSGQSGALQKSAHPDLGYELKPNLELLFKLAPVRINSRGLNDQEYSTEKDDNTFRVVVVGDSFTMPVGVAIENAWHSLIEERLGRHNPRRVEFINFAVAGYSLDQEVASLQHKALAYKPDLVILGFCAENDFQLPSNHTNIWLHGPNREANGFSRIYLFDLIDLALAGQRSPFPRRYTEHQIAYVRNQFGRLQALASGVGARAVVAYLHLGLEDPVPIQRLALDAGLDFVDAGAPLRGGSPARYFIYMFDGHPNAAANLIFADVIGRHLLDEKLIPTAATTELSR